jgi:magnesium transporter
MIRSVKRASKKAGLPPGTLIHTGEKKVGRVEVRVMQYDENKYEKRIVSTIEECFPLMEPPTVNWIDIDGVHEVDVIKEIGEKFDLHPLVLEDIATTEQRPKLDDFDDHIFIIQKVLTYDHVESQLRMEQVSFVLGPNSVISFQENSEDDIFYAVKERIKKGKGRIRRMGPDYLAYVLLDTIVDNYFIVIEKIEDEIESLEEDLITNPSKETLYKIHNLGKDLIFLRKSVSPLRDVISVLMRGESTLVQDKTKIFLSDVYDHTIQVIDTIEIFREMIPGMLDVYLSSVSNRTSEVMRVLTIVATIFIPLTFVAGIYGMNFKYMPELEFKWGYPVVLGVMLVIGVSILVWVLRKRWL